MGAKKTLRVLGESARKMASPKTANAENIK